jgi:methionyl-tRNA formyltransferase
MKSINELNIVMYGTGALAEQALLTMQQANIVPKILITKPDAAVGRSRAKTPPNIAIIAKSFGIHVLQPNKLQDISHILEEFDLDIGIVASYGKILPQDVLDIPIYGTLNIHPSLLPKYRGPTPIETALTSGDNEFGVSIMFLDSQVDHGPVLYQKEFDDFEKLPDATLDTFEKLAGIYGASMLVTSVLEPFIHGAITAKEQDHENATYTRKFSKEDGKVDIENDSLDKILQVYRATTSWPGCYFLHMHKGSYIRVKISKMTKEGEDITITHVVPEGRKEMSWESFKNGFVQK